MSFWQNKSVLVTGGFGFTGSHLCRELHKAGAKVKAFGLKNEPLFNLEDIRDKIELCAGDVTDLESLLSHLKGVDYVFNPAAIVPVMDARNNPQKSFYVNGIGSFNVAHASLKCGVKKMLHISTCHIYGNLPESELPIKETAVPEPGDLYAVSKYAAEIYMRPLIDEGAPIVISRAFAKYGPGQGPQYFIPRVITQLLKGVTPKLGNRKPTRDYSYITDVARGYMLLLEKGKPGEVYHLSSHKETSMGEVFDLIVKVMGVQVTPEWHSEPRPQDILRLFGDSSRARRDFGWKPEISLEEGLRRTVQWWKDHPDLLKAG